MRAIHPSDEVSFRGGIKIRDDDETLLGVGIANAGHQNSGVRLRTWLLGILGFLVASLLFVNGFVTGQFRMTHFINATAIRNNFVNDHVHLVDQKISGYLVNNEGCRIAALDPFDSVSRRYMRKEKPIECKNGDRMPLIESNDTAIYVNPVAVDRYYNESETLDCCWRSFTRKAGQDNAVTYDSVCHRFQDSASISAEFIKVECFHAEKQIYRDYHAFVPRKNITEKRCREAESSSSSSSSSEDRLSVLVIGLDSVSRLNFHRTMPRTIETLRKLRSIELLGYNKVGDNTYPNLVPVLSGLSSSELESTCLGNKKIPFDDCPFLWKNFSDKGYRTIFAEDACSMTTFNYVKPGFRDSPTDYYLRPYCIAAENDIGNNHKLNANLCLGVRKNFENLLDYGHKVAARFANDPYFAFIWQASLTHDFINYPQLGDLAYSRFIQNLHNKDLLKNTALIVMSDHGMRWGDYRQTYQGRMEDSLPFVFFIFPEWWRTRYTVKLANLRKNAKSLTTPYDLHETLLDIVMSNERIRDDAGEERASRYDSKRRGYSLFEPVPNDRTCSMAGIPEHWCMCHTSNDAPINDTRVIDATVYMMNELNGLVKDYPQCSLLSLVRVLDAKFWHAGGVDVERGDKKKNAPWIDYTITAITVPGDGVFEATIRHNGTSDRLVGSISRLNAYGTQSSCVDDSNMRLYCYCY